MHLSQQNLFSNLSMNPNLIVVYSPKDSMIRKKTNFRSKSQSILNKLFQKNTECTLITFYQKCKSLQPTLSRDDFLHFLQINMDKDKIDIEEDDFSSPHYRITQKGIQKLNTTQNIVLKTYLKIFKEWEINSEYPYIGIDDAYLFYKLKKNVYKIFVTDVLKQLFNYGYIFNCASPKNQKQEISKYFEKYRWNFRYVFNDYNGVYIPYGSILVFRKGGPAILGDKQHNGIVLPWNNHPYVIHAHGGGVTMPDYEHFLEDAISYFVYYSYEPDRILFGDLVYLLSLEIILKQLESRFKYVYEFKQGKGLINPFRKCILSSNKKAIWRSSSSPFQQMKKFRDTLLSPDETKKQQVVCSTFVFYFYALILYELMVFHKHEKISTDLSIYIHKTENNSQRRNRFLKLQNQLTFPVDDSLESEYNNKYNWDIKVCWPQNALDLAKVYPHLFTAVKYPTH